MSKVSVIIPARNEEYLVNTVEDIYKNFSEDFEIIVILDGETEYPVPKEKDNLILVYKNTSEGMRKAINDGAKRATGDFLMKVDAHCLFSEGFDKTLKEECEDNWVVIPRRYSLDTVSWKELPRTTVEYYYISFPWPGNSVIKDLPWYKRSNERKDILVDETLSIQGSFWLTKSKYFKEVLNGFDETNYGVNFCENQELVFKTWLGGGKVIVNKKAYYAHLHKGNMVRNWYLSINDLMRSYTYSTNYWVNNNWEGRIHDFSWLVERFWPLPLENTKVRGEKYFWPENWKEILYDRTM